MTQWGLLINPSGFDPEFAIIVEAETAHAAREAAKVLHPRATISFPWRMDGGPPVPTPPGAPGSGR